MGSIHEFPQAMLGLVIPQDNDMGHIWSTVYFLFRRVAPIELNPSSLVKPFYRTSDANGEPSYPTTELVRRDRGMWGIWTRC
jgi:hypothetical protein